MRNLIEIGLPTLILLAIIFLAPLLVSIPLFHTLKWVLIIFFVASSYISRQITHFGLEERNEKFPAYYLTSTVIRMVLSLIFLFVFVYLKIENLFLFVANFLAFYFFYVGFEIYYLFGNLRPNTNNRRKDAENI